jgi:uncharacterized membrane protein
MKDFLRRHPLVCPILMLLLVSGLGLMLLAARIVLSRHLRHLYLPWNLFLAWVPLGFALWARHLERYSAAGRPWVSGLRGLVAVTWLLFLPNAPYILTDLVHLPDRGYRHYFADMMLILHFALVGLMLGFISLHVMHTVVERRWGWLHGWIFTVVATGLTGLGVYFGRVLRWNSWDVFFSPGTLIVELVDWVQRLVQRPSETVLPALFGSIMLLAYVLFASLLRPSMTLEPGWDGIKNHS